MKFAPHTNDRTLESLKIFPYVAWGLTFLFAFFVYSIVQDLKDVTQSLEAQTEWLQSQIHATTSPEHTDFEQ